ncbi:hypothetical protein [Entomobacter blattae]|uniref:Lipoprotein n=1 Tax=Entomobacter blattae TaxID=2762277 RepID=A0A7H1NUR6_9PROT|nr:hypothetical protein [Entomobacter blattae]QNT79526.1 hypothetical protein JGUZn3_23250 [Entomobacter blattae]
MKRSLYFALLCSLPLLSTAACSDSSPKQANFSPIHYSQYSQLHFNVSQKTFRNAAQPEDDDISKRSPVTPLQAIRQMYDERIFASGSSGRLVFTVDRAAIIPLGSNSLQGIIDIHIDLLTASGQNTGYAEVHVKRSYTPNTGDDLDLDSPVYLYKVTKEMMKSLNGELESQVKATLREWLVDAGGTALNSAIKTTSLSSPNKRNTVLQTGQKTYKSHSTNRPSLVHPSQLP